MNLLETIIVVLIFGAFSVLIPMGLSYLIIKIYYYIKDRIFSEEDFNKNLKYPEHDSRNLKRAEFRAKHEPALSDSAVKPLALGMGSVKRWRSHEGTVWG